jgi:hypothetical protein
MSLDEAIRLVGNQNRRCIANMVQALGMMAWMNTEEDERRRKAGKLVLRAMKQGTYYWPPKGRWRSHCVSLPLQREGTVQQPMGEPL